MSKDPDGEVLDVGRPLRRQLEELDVVPLHAVDRHCGAENTIRPRPPAFALRLGGRGVPLSMVCCCLAVQMSRLMPSIT